jgi:hypothetical protein
VPSALDILTKALSRAFLSETPRDVAARAITELSAAGFCIIPEEALTKMLKEAVPWTSSR